MELIKKIILPSFVKSQVILFLISLISINAFSQTSGLQIHIIDELSKEPIPFAYIRIEENNKNYQCDEMGMLKVPISPGSYTVLCTHLSYQSKAFKIQVNENSVKKEKLYLFPKSKTIDTVEVNATQHIYESDEKYQVSTIRIDPKALGGVPTGTGDFNQMLAVVGLGIVSNQELGSTYAVRGGNYDENLVYVNGVEVYRPFLARSGQQEGLSFVNPDLVSDIQFSAGGWQPKYGDKLSSVLNVTYDTPKKRGSSASLSLMGLTFHNSFISKNQRFTSLIGVRHKDARYFLNFMEVKGQYFPVYSDGQALFSYRLNKNTQEGALTKINLLLFGGRNRYRVIPTERQSTFGTFNQQLRLYVNYKGQERLQYETGQAVLQLERRSRKKFVGLTSLSYLQTAEEESIDVEALYRLCDVDTDVNSENFNKCILTRGVASEFSYARNALFAQITSLDQQLNWYVSDAHQIQAGANFKYEIIHDRLDEYKFRDSVDYTELTHFLRSEAQLQVLKPSAFIQWTAQKDSTHTLTVGLRYTSSSLNQQHLVSPRVQYAYKAPQWKNTIFTAAAGFYNQLPFYREMRNYAGEVNTKLRAQRSFHYIMGLDYNFKAWNRPFKFLAESYYKYGWDIAAYDVDNIRLRYYGQNDAVSQTYGADFRISGEFIKDTESWINLSVMRSIEDVDFDKNGYIRRPSDQRVTATIFFEDHIPGDPTLRMYLRLIYGSGMPFSPPNSIEYRSFFRMSPYRRVDVGFSKLISRNPVGSGIRNAWIRLEILNLLGVENVIGYTWVDDFVTKSRFPVPNSLSQRFFNLRVYLDW